MGTVTPIGPAQQGDENAPGSPSDGKPALGAPFAAEDLREPDWERIRTEYEAGVLTTREIAAASTASGAPVSHVTIWKHAKRDGWVQDTRGRVTRRADELVTRAQLAQHRQAHRAEQQRRREQQATGSVEASREKVSTAEIIEFRAATVAQVRLFHQRDIDRARTLCMRLLGELESQVYDRLTHETIADLVLTPGEEADSELAAKAAQAQANKRRAALDAVMALPEQTKTMKALVEALERLLNLERTAYGIVAPRENEEPPPARDTGTARDHYEWLARQRPT